MLEVQSFFEHDQARIDRRKNSLEMMTIHLDVDGANGRPIRHHPEIARQMLDRIFGEERHAIIGDKAMGAQIAGDLTRQLAKLSIADRASIFGGHNAGFVRMPLRGAIDPIPDQLWPGFRLLHTVTSRPLRSRV